MRRRRVRYAVAGVGIMCAIALRFGSRCCSYNFSGTHWDKLLACTFCTHNQHIDPLARDHYGRGHKLSTDQNHDTFDHTSIKAINQHQ